MCRGVWGRCDDEVSPSTGILLLEKTKNLLKANGKVYSRDEDLGLLYETDKYCRSSCVPP